MTDLEKWAIFFRYADSERSREKVNEVIASKEELQMAGELLMSISKDERERAVFRSRRMYQTDLMSNLATAEDRGRREGTHDAMIILPDGCWHRIILLKRLWITLSYQEKNSKSFVRTANKKFFLQEE